MRHLVTAETAPAAPAHLVRARARTRVSRGLGTDEPGRVTGDILWANLHLLFWLSLVPFVTAWMGENHFAPVPVAAYGVVLLMAAIAYWLLQREILRSEGPLSLLAAALSGERHERG